jgi:hypothetical protein
MTRQRPNGGLRPPARPFESQQLAEEQIVSDEVSRIMNAIRDFDQDKVTATVWLKSGNGTGPWRMCDDVGLPPDMPAIMADMRERFGAGDYELRVSALGRVRANSLFSLAKEKTPAVAPPAAAPAPGGLGSDFLGMLLTQQSEARRDAQAAADRQMTMLTGLATAILPAILQRPATPPGISAGEIAALMAAGAGGKGGSMKEMVETLVALKGLTENPAPRQVVTASGSTPRTC